MKSSIVRPEASSCRRARVLSFALAPAVLLSFTGCAVQSAGPVVQPAASHLSGSVHGGQQPVAGATIQLWAAGSAGYGSAATPLIASAVLTDANGNFAITGDYTCPSGSMVYLTASGGNPGAGTNPALALMAALGPCSALSANTVIQVNELTTVSSVWALAPFMSGPSALGTSAGNGPGLARAFAAVNKLVNTSTGAVSGPALPAGAVLPVAELNTLADILAGCVNSTGNTGTGSTCGKLFAAAQTASSTPADTITAAVNIAHQPSANVAALCALAASNAPFQPTLSCATPPNAWTVAIQYKGGGLSVPKAIAVDASGNVWLPNAGNNSVTELDNTGAAVSSGTGYANGALSTPSAVAIDLTGNAWIANAGNASISRITPQGGSVTSFSGGGLNVPQSIAIDASGEVWVGNVGNSSVSEFTNAGVALSPAGTGFTGSGLSQPTAIAVNPN